MAESIQIENVVDLGAGGVPLSEYPPNNEHLKREEVIDQLADGTSPEEVLKVVVDADGEP